MNYDRAGWPIGTSDRCTSLSSYFHFTETAKICAAQERRQSVQDAHEIATQREKQKALGITQYHELKDFELLESQLSPVIDRWKDYFPNNVVNRIIAA